jgi:hypothetical protein
VLPDTKENFLGDILSFGVVAEHSPRQTDHSREMPADEFGRGALVARADTAHQFLVRIPHGLEANSEKRFVRPAGQPIKADLLSTLCILPRRLPSATCSLAEPASARLWPFPVFVAQTLEEPASVDNGPILRVRRTATEDWRFASLASKVEKSLSPK